ncbi:MAG: MmcQ/YjbR family DNA-binding protein [Chloroflexota bacterium]|nr:MmcQ/YjbR family DNA-binding protein [Chloroflexota bacterium]
MTTLKAAKARLLKYALAKPDATLDHPWGENVAKVRGKVFVFFGLETSPGVMGVKLTDALLYAKSLPYVEAMGYGLGKSGWVTVNAPKGALLAKMFEEWIDESYANVAPKRKARVSTAAPKAPGRSAAHRAPARRTTSRSSGR